MIGIGNFSGIGVAGKDDVKVPKPAAEKYKEKNRKSFKQYLRDNNLSKKVKLPK